MEEVSALLCAFTSLRWSDVPEYMLRKFVSKACDARGPRLVAVSQLTEHVISRSPTSVLANIAGKVTAQSAQVGLDMTHQDAREWRAKSFHRTPGDAVLQDLVS